MQLYLPIAEQSLDIFLLLTMGLGVGFVAGLFGVGGGFLLTPMLILIGIPPAIAVGTVTAQITATSMSGTLNYWQRRELDVKLGLVLLAGSLMGSLTGVWLFKRLNQAGQLDFVIALGFTILLGFIGYSLIKDNLSKLFGTKRQINLRQRPHPLLLALPLKMRFKTSKLYISAIAVMLIGYFIGLLGAILGIGGGFLLLPALIYILRVPFNLVQGTTLFMTLFTMIVTTIMQATFNNSVDVMLALPLIVGGVIGTQFGVQLARKIKMDWLTLLLGLLLIVVAVKFLVGLILRPDDPFLITPFLGA